MKNLNALPIAKKAILTLAEIKAVIEAFDRGDSNAFDALDAIVVAVDAYRMAVTEDSKRSRRRRDAA